MLFSTGCCVSIPREQRGGEAAVEFFQVWETHAVDGDESHMVKPSSHDGLAEKGGARDRFRRHLVEWKEQSRYLSNTAQMAMLRPYQRIIGMGMAAVPLILEELHREPDQWFWALESITEENPVPPKDAGRVRAMADAWIHWGTQHGFLGQ
jgi:hypothetical protein